MHVNNLPFIQAVRLPLFAALVLANNLPRCASEQTDEVGRPFRMCCEEVIILHPNSRSSADVFPCPSANKDRILGLSDHLPTHLLKFLRDPVFFFSLHRDPFDL